MTQFTLHHGDCLPYLKSLPAESVALIVTDPPYDIKNTKAGGTNPLRGRMNRSQEELTELDIVSGFDMAILDEMVRVCKGVNIYIFCNKQQLPLYFQYFVNGLDCAFDLIKWVKSNSPPTFNNKYLSDTEYCFYARKGAYCNPENYADGSTLYQSPCNVKDKRLYNHPTPKPVELLRRLIRNSSQRGEVILDPFSGSGSTGEAALLEGRQFIGCEMNADHYVTSYSRLLTVSAS